MASVLTTMHRCRLLLLLLLWLWSGAALGALGVSRRAQRISRHSREPDEVDREMTRLHDVINGFYEAKHGPIRLRDSDIRNNNTQYDTTFKSPQDCELPTPLLRQREQLYQRNSSQRIAGGRDAYQFEFPSYIGIRGENWKHDLSYCGGVLLTTNVVLTAAHCAVGFTEFLLSPTVVPQRQWFDKRVEMIRGVQACVAPNFMDGLDRLWDFAVIILERPVHVGGLVQTGCMGVKKVSVGDIVELGGNGFIGHQYDDKGQFTETPATTFQAAKQKVANCFDMDKHIGHMCTTATAMNQPSTICSGDSGSGVYSVIDKSLVVVGLASFARWAKPCRASAGSYTVHVAVHHWAYNIRDFANNCLMKAAAAAGQPGSGQRSTPVSVIDLF